VAGVVTEIGHMRSLAHRIVVGNGPELTSRASDQWVLETRVEVAVIRQGNTVEAFFVESFSA
jgi:hypothetical protein